MRREISRSSIISTGRIRNIPYSGKIAFVLSSGAIESSIILLFNQLSNSSGLVGKNLMDHPAGLWSRHLPGSHIYISRCPPTTSGIDAFRDGEFRKESSAFRISIGNDGWSRFVRKDNPQGLDNLEFLINEKFGTKDFVIGKPLRDAIASQITRIFRFSYSTEMLPDEANKVELNNEPVDPITNLPRPKISFKIDRNGDYNSKGFLMAGRVLTGLFTTLQVATADFDVQNDQANFSGAGHIMGTLRMGKDPKRSVVNPDLRSHDHSNLYLLGSGIFPTACTANPTLTIAAFSLRLADHLINQFQSGKQ